MKKVVEEEEEEEVYAVFIYWEREKWGGRKDGWMDLHRYWMFQEGRRRRQEGERSPSF